ncbi:933_t:CDS:2 [Ambispora leptoticha]|uniref:933_t:CDS:1 n=1 Tax=Ambispora leptoticha TaxID=144679 RepID=A0A9N8W2T5_9GLOM|nr:933_t:CDS:2 [Ambispora leptoticha]
MFLIINLYYGNSSANISNVLSPPIVHVSYYQLESVLRPICVKLEPVAIKTGPGIKY